MVEASYAHVGNNFALTFHDEALRDVQPTFEITTSAYARSFQESVFVRPTDSIDVIANYFLPGFVGGDHALEVRIQVPQRHGVHRQHVGRQCHRAVPERRRERGGTLPPVHHASTACTTGTSTCRTATPARR